MTVTIEIGDKWNLNVHEMSRVRLSSLFSWTNVFFFVLKMSNRPAGSEQKCHIYTQRTVKMRHKCMCEPHAYSLAMSHTSVHTAHTWIERYAYTECIQMNESHPTNDKTQKQRWICFVSVSVCVYTQLYELFCIRHFVSALVIHMHTNLTLIVFRRYSSWTDTE